MQTNYFGWHVLYVKYQHEKKIESRMKARGLDSFVPTFMTIRQWSDRKKKVILPLFPCYVFININSKKEFHNALVVEGVFKYLNFGGIYAKVCEDEINRIKGFLKLEEISELRTTSDSPRMGELMVINHGSLSGLECKVIRTGNKNKVFVRIESLRRNITAVVPSNYLTKSRNSNATEHTQQRVQ